MSDVTAADLLSHAEALRKEKRYEAAMPLLERALAAAPGDVACLVSLARCHRGLDRLDESDRCFQEAIAARPDEIQVRIEHIRTLIERRARSEARQALGEALALAADHPELAELAVELADGHGEAELPLYAQLEYGPFKRLWSLNENLNRRFRKDAGGTIIGMLETALLADCHDTALGIARYTLTQMPAFVPALRAKALSMTLEALLAHGEIEAARSALLEHFDVVHLRDEIFALCSRLMSSDDAVEPEYARSPSGGLNSFYLDGLGPAGGETALKLLFRDSDQFTQRPDNFLLLASHFARQGDSCRCRDFLNRFLTAYGMEPVTALDLGADILGGVTFARPAVCTSGPLVSVVIAARNAAALVGYSIRSILEQSHEPVEVLFCDDASEDGTLERANELFGNDPRVRLFRSVAAQGPYNIRNALIARARGEYVTFQDADDLSLPTRLARQLAFLRETPKALAVCGQWCRVTPRGRFVFFKDGSALRLATVSLMARRETFLRYGPYDAVLHGADTDLIERIRSIHGNGVVQTLKLPLLFGLWSGGSLTRRIGSEATEDGLRGDARRQYSEAKFRQRFELASHGAVRPLRLANHLPPREVIAVTEKGAQA